MSIITDNLDWVLALIVAILAIAWFVKFRVLPRSKTARRASTKLREEIRNRTK